MSTSLCKISKMDPRKLVLNNYFQSYIEEAGRVNLLSKVEITNLQLQLVKLLEIQIQRYTRFESSSVKVETAEGLMRSILYALDFRLKYLKGELEEGVYSLKDKSLETIFREGVALIKVQISKSKVYLQKVQENRLKLDNYAYNDTINHAFTDFFPYYEAEFSFQSNAADIDYPLCIDEMKEENIEYVYSYLKKLYYENEFCGYFPLEDIKSLLVNAYPNANEMLMNIFELVLINVIGRKLVHKDLTRLALSEIDCEALQSQFENAIEVEELVQRGAELVIDDLKITGFLRHYILKALPPIAVRIKSGVAHKALDKIFIPFNRAEDKQAIYFTDGESLSDDAFKEMIEAVCSCKLVIEKLMIFKEKVHSLKDMVDFLEAECLFGKEYSALYSSLSQIEIALLLNMIGLTDEQSFKLRLKDITEQKSLLHPWEDELIQFIAQKQEDVRQQMWLIVQNISI